MRKRAKVRSRLLWIICSVFLFADLSVESLPAATSAQVTSARNTGLAWLIENQNGDGSWSSVPGLRVQATSATINAFLQAGIKNGLWYNSAVAYLANASPLSIDGRARQLRTLYLVGRDTSKLSTSLQSLGGGTAGGFAWGTLPGYATSLADTALATSALLSTVSGYTGYGDTLCNVLIPYQRTSGGWSYLGQGTNSPASSGTANVLPTALTIMALQQIGSQGLSTFSCGTTSYSMSTIVGNGVSFLLANQNGDHGFGDNGTSGALETVLAYLAIQAVNPNHAALGPAQNYLIAQQLGNGSWENDALQTSLVLQSFPSVQLPDSNGDGIPDAVAAVLNVGPNGASGRSLVAGNGQSVPGTTQAQLLGSINVGTSFQATLPSRGTGPFTYQIVSGSLPTGLLLAANGAISGVATSAGTYNFTYQVTDSNHNATVLTAQIVANPAPVIVASGSWSGPLLLWSGNTTKGAPNAEQVQFDAIGNGIAIWEQGATLQLGRYLKASNSWSVENFPGFVSYPTMPLVSGASLAMDDGGDAIVAWSQYAGTGWLYVSRYNATTNSWDNDPTLLAQSSTQTIESGATAINTTGSGGGSVTAAVAWTQNNGSQSSSYTALWNGTSWGPAAQLATSLVEQQVAVGIANVITVLSTDATTPGAPLNLYVNTGGANGGSSWSAASLFWTADVFGETDPQVAFDNTNNGIAVWMQNLNLMARRYDASSGWSATPVVLVSGAWSPSLSIDRETGNAVLAFEGINATAATYSAYVSLYTAATNSWSTPTPLGNQSTLDAGPLSPAGIATAIRGDNAVVGWLQGNSNPVISTFNVSRWNGTAWGAAEMLVPSTNTAAISNTAVGIDAQGDVSALWSQGTNVYLNYYGPVAPSL